ncbi:hypothetical protein ACLKA6_004567 [Drosophila palustris]
MAQEEEPNCNGFPDFTIEGSQVYRHLGHRPEEEDYVPWKLCVAFDHRPRVLAECHDHPTAGHSGIRKTIARISQRYYWPGLFRDVARYVKQCEKCQKFKVSQLKPAGRMLTRQVEEPFGTLCADFVGPLPRSKHGNTMLLVFFDAFTKWVELIPLRKATSAHLERAFREAILSSTWPTDPTSLPRPRGSSWESVRDTAGGTLVGLTTPTTLSTVRTIRIRAERQPPTQASGHGGVPRSGRGLGSRRGERSPTTAELIGHRTVGEMADLAAINSNFNLNLGANIVL